MSRTWRIACSLRSGKTNRLLSGEEESCSERRCSSVSPGPPLSTSVRVGMQNVGRGKAGDGLFILLIYKLEVENL